MTDAFARSTAWVALGQSMVKLAQVVIAAVLVRLVDVATWNETAFLLTIYVTGAAIGTLNAHHGIVFFLPRVGRERGRSLVQRTITFVLAIGGLGVVAALVVAGLVEGPSAGESLVLVAIAVALELPSACVGTTLVALQRFRSAAQWDLVGTVSVVAGCIVPAAMGAGAPGVALGLVVAGALRLPIGLAIIRRVLPGGDTVDRAAVLGLVRYGLPLALTIAVAMLNRVVDKWFIGVFEPEQFGIYAVAAQEIPLLSVLPYAGGAALLTALVDAFRSGDLSLARSHWLHLTMRMSSVVVPLGIGIALVAPDLLTVAFTADFAPAVLSFQVFTLITIHRVAEYGMLLRAAGRTRAVVHVALLTLAANAVFAGLGAAAGGMTGASIGTAAATALGWMIAMRHIAATLGVRVRDAFAWLAWLVQVSIAGSAAVFAAIATSRLDAAFDLATAPRVITKVVLFSAGVVLGARWWRSHPRSVGPAVRYVPDTSLRPVGATR
jgi:O-antigen/teichoic acid export membrane protein